MNEKYLKHILDNPVFTRPDVRSRVFALPVCPKCERPLLRDKGFQERGIATCIHCGYSGPSSRTVGIHAKEV